MSDKVLANELKAVLKDGILRCPKCSGRLFHFSGYGKQPEQKYCILCYDVGYDKEGNPIVFI